MTHPLVLLISALITGCAAAFYAQSKGAERSVPMVGTLAFLVPISLPLITLYLMGKSLPAGGHIKPQIAILLTVGNIIAMIGIVAILNALAGD